MNFSAYDKKNKGGCDAYTFKKQNWKPVNFKLDIFDVIREFLFIFQSKPQEEEKIFVQLCVCAFKILSINIYKSHLWNFKL